jgi:hypothetical protein
MTWRELPPRLHGRVPRVTLLEALPAIVGTLAFGVLWLVGPIVLVYVFAAREQYVLVALLAPFTLLWLYAIVREPVVPGLLLAAPASIRSVIRQQRGMVHTEDLERGRLVGLSAHRALTAGEQAALLALVRQVGDLPELGRQIERCEVIAECVCGCASVRLLSRAPSIPRDASRANAQGERDNLAIGGVAPGPGDRATDLVLHVQLGTLRELEVTHGGVHDGSADAIPDAATIRPAGVRTAPFDPT